MHHLGEGCSLLCLMGEVKIKVKVIHPNGWWCMPQEPVPEDPGRDEDPGPVDSPLMALPASLVPRAGLGWVVSSARLAPPDLVTLTSRDPAGTPASDGNAALAAHSALPAPSGICPGGVGATGGRAGYALGFQRRRQSGTTWP